MLCHNIFKNSVIIQNKPFGFFSVVAAFFRTCKGLDCNMDGAEKGGACERNPIQIWVSLNLFASKICRQVLRLLYIGPGPKGEMKRLLCCQVVHLLLEQIGKFCWGNEGLVRTQSKKV